MSQTSFRVMNSVYQDVHSRSRTQARDANYTKTTVAANTEEKGSESDQTIEEIKQQIDDLKRIRDSSNSPDKVPLKLQNIGKYILKVSKLPEPQFNQSELELRRPLKIIKPHRYEQAIRPKRRTTSHPTRESVSSLRNSSVYGTNEPFPTNAEEVSMMGNLTQQLLDMTSSTVDERGLKLKVKPIGYPLSRPQKEKFITNYENIAAIKALRRSYDKVIQSQGKLVFGRKKHTTGSPGDNLSNDPYSYSYFSQSKQRPFRDNSLTDLIKFDTTQIKKEAQKIHRRSKEGLTIVGTSDIVKKKSTILRLPEVKMIKHLSSDSSEQANMSLYMQNTRYDPID